MKMMTAISAATLVMFAANAFAHTEDSNRRLHKARRPAADLVSPYAVTGATNNQVGYGFYPDAPDFSVAPRGGNSGGANFPHSGT